VTVYLVRRFATMLMTLAVISALVFIIINLPPGNYLSNQIAEMRSSGEAAGVAQAEALIAQYSLDKPVWQQYFIWVGALPGPDEYPRDRSRRSVGELSAFLDAGYSRDQAIEVVMVISLKFFSNLTGNLTGIPLDDAFAPFEWKPSGTRVMAA
jgi:hypothetical protein